MKVVLDTNVFVSGVFFSGPPCYILKAWRDGKIQLLVSEKVLDEYVRVAEILCEQFSEIQLGPIIELLAVEAEFVSPKDLSRPVCVDPDDDKFLECALAGKAKVIVSGDKHLIEISGYRNLEIISPRSFVEKFLKKATK